jgi:hypothetical protein
MSVHKSGLSVSAVVNYCEALAFSSHVFEKAHEAPAEMTAVAIRKTKVRL